MRRARIGNATERRSVRPGIMPTLFGQIVQPLAMFLSLDELAEELPPLEEFLGDGACDLPEDVRAEYLRVERALVDKAREMMGRGSMKLLGTMIHTLLAYPDHPYGWVPHFEGEESVGYWELPKVYTRENWRGVVSPYNFDLANRILPKERKLIDLCKVHAAQKNQVWVFCQQTQKRNVMPRLKTLLEAEGLRVGILRSGDVDMRERAAWITEHGLDYDVMLSHPKLVSTGLDLFSKEKGGHNFNVLVFFETGYNLFDMRQASRRSWRIGQPKDCEIHYLYCRGTMEQRAMLLMAKKAEAATSLEGDVSVEGLAALAGDDNAQMAMVRALAEKIDDKDIMRKWGRVRFGVKKPPKPEPTEEEKAAAAARAEAEARRHREMEEMLEGVLNEEPDAAELPKVRPKLKTFDVYDQPIRYEPGRLLGTVEATNRGAVYSKAHELWPDVWPSSIEVVPHGRPLPTRSKPAAEEEPVETAVTVAFPSRTLAGSPCFAPTADQEVADAAASVLSLARHAMHDHGLAAARDEEELIAALLTGMNEPGPVASRPDPKPMPKGVQEIQPRGRLTAADYAEIFGDLLHGMGGGDERGW
jgi:hypothetical protein